MSLVITIDQAALAYWHLVKDAEEQHLVAMIRAVTCFEAILDRRGDRTKKVLQETEFGEDVPPIQAEKRHSQIRTSLVSEHILVSQALVDDHLHWTGMHQ